MRRIAHISDLHFCRTDPAVVEALAEELNADAPDLVAVSGDLTMRARRREYRAAREFLDQLRAPVLAVPGNHDITPFRLVERFLDPLARWRSHIAADAEPMFHDEEIAVVGINTASRAGTLFDWSRGRVRASGLAQAVERLRSLPPGLFRIVVAHHPFLPPESAPDTPLVRRAEAALAVFAREGVRLVLSGHLHLGFIRARGLAADAAQAGGAAGPGTGPLLVVQAATATSTRLRGEPNAYNRITIRGGVAQVEVRTWTGKGWTSPGLAP